MNFPGYRMRRMRRTPALRAMIRETKLSPEDLIMPYFVREGEGIERPIASMPGNSQLSIDCLVARAGESVALGVPAVILFGIPEVKDPLGRSGSGPESVVYRAIQALKSAHPELVVIADVCLCEYTDHGHCGAITERRDGQPDVDNDVTLDLLTEMAVSYAEAGADIVAPSDMMDGRVAAIRGGLDAGGLSEIPIMAYSAKFASSFYGPFRDAAESPPQFGDRKTYQMDPANAEEALREVGLDIEEGADIVMVKPALPYLDLIHQVRERFGYPLAAYNVSGEFAMIKAAAQAGWLDERAAALEGLLSIKRAGADLILTYWANDAARWLA